MGKIERNPTPQDTVLNRVRLACGLSVNGLADEINVGYDDVRHACLSDVAGEETLWATHEYVTRRLALLLAAKAELERRMRPLQQERVLRIAASGEPREASRTLSRVPPHEPPHG